MKYFIPSIEGMRAIAVLAVLAFHLDIPGAGGGFLGVDMFFVISGFVITRKILTQYDDGEFNLASFYYSRFRRLIPALSAVILLTLTFAAPLLPAEDLESTGQAAVFAGVSFSNVWFWLQADYFDAAAHTKPLLHTWSLGVEEQFYLVWPILLLALLRWRRILPAACVALALLSLLAGANTVVDDSSAVFFLTPFRAYQLMLGALIAVTRWHLPAKMDGAAQLIGVAGFCLAATTLTGEHSPLVSGGLATAASVLMLLGRESSAANSMLGNHAFRWIGQRSYAIYLVHWPIIVLYKYASSPKLGVIDQCVLAGLSIAAAMMLHRFVERPFRRHRTTETSFERSATPITISMLLLGGLIAAIFWGMRGFPELRPVDIQTAVIKAKEGVNQRLSNVRTGICHAGSGFTLADYDEVVCAPFDSRKVNVLVIGDSIAADMFLILREAYPDVVFSQATGGSCGAFAGRSKYSGCKAINDFRFDVLAKKDYDYVVLAGFWRESNARYLMENIVHVASLGRKVIVVGPGLQFNEDVIRTMSMSTSIAEAERTTRAGEDRKTALNEKLKGTIKSAKYVDFMAVQCRQQCDVFDGENLLYIDQFHISPHGTKIFARRLAEGYPDLFR